MCSFENRGKMQYPFNRSTFSFPWNKGSDLHLSPLQYMERWGRGEAKYRRLEKHWKVHTNLLSSHMPDCWSCMMHCNLVEVWHGSEEEEEDGHLSMEKHAGGLRSSGSKTGDQTVQQGVLAGGGSDSQAVAASAFSSGLTTKTWTSGGFSWRQPQGPNACQFPMCLPPTHTLAQLEAAVDFWWVWSSSHRHLVPDDRDSAKLLNSKTVSGNLQNGENEQWDTNSLARVYLAQSWFIGI